MKICEEINFDCNVCFESNASICATINIPSTNLIEDDEYYIYLEDEKNNKYESTILGKTNGSFDISNSTFENVNLFLVGDKKHKIYLSDTQGGNAKTLTINGNDYVCVIISI